MIRPLSIIIPALCFALPVSACAQETKPNPARQMWCHRKNLHLDGRKYGASSTIQRLYQKLVESWGAGHAALRALARRRVPLRQNSTQLSNSAANGWLSAVTQSYAKTGRKTLSYTNEAIWKPWRPKGSTPQPRSWRAWQARPTLHSKLDDWLKARLRKNMNSLTVPTQWLRRSGRSILCHGRVITRRNGANISKAAF